MVQPDDRLKGIGSDVVVRRGVDAFPLSFDVEAFSYLLFIE
jgi:hypothetical protein